MKRYQFGKLEGRPNPMTSRKRASVHLGLLFAVSCGGGEPPAGGFAPLSDQERREANVPTIDGSCSRESAAVVGRGSVRRTLALPGGAPRGDGFVAAGADGCGNWFVLYDDDTGSPGDVVLGTPDSLPQTNPRVTLAKIYADGTLAWTRTVPPFDSPASALVLGVGVNGVAAVGTQSLAHSDENPSGYRIDWWQADGRHAASQPMGGMAVQVQEFEGDWWLDLRSNARAAFVMDPQTGQAWPPWPIEEEDLEVPSTAEHRRLDLAVLGDGGHAWIGITDARGLPAYARVEGEDEGPDSGWRLYVRRLIPPGKAEELLKEPSVPEGHAYVANLLVEDLESSCQTIAGTVAANDETVFAGYACTHDTSDLADDARYSWNSSVVALEGRKVAWQWDGPPDMQVLRVLAAPDGRVVALGRQLGGDDGQQDLSLFVLSQLGELEWSRTYSDDDQVPNLNRDASGRWDVNASALTPDGHVLVGAIIERLTPEASRTYWVGELRWTE